MKSLPLGARLALATAVIALVAVAGIWAAHWALERFAVPVSSAIITAVAVVVTALVISLKRANVINHHDQHRLDLPPHWSLHLGWSALVLGVAVAWAYHSIAARLPFASSQQWITAAVGGFVTVAVVWSEWRGLRERARFEPAWSRD